MKLQNKVAIVSGGAAGIGEASCRLFAQEGARIACLDRNVSGAERVCENIRKRGQQARAYAMLLSNCSMDAVTQRLLIDILRPHP